ncbi:MAG: helix-turn-helix transcriptional regulator [Candidatus Helarchaeota archaeon]
MFSVFDQEPIPNKFTVGMGEKIRLAREEAGLSQKELAKKIFRRRATVSDIENGKSELGTIILSRISAILEKPISYFFPDFAIREINPNEITPIEKELLLIYDLLYDENLKNIALHQMRTLAEYRPEI